MKRLERVPIVVWLAVFAAVVYWQGATTRYYGDDLTFVFDDPGSRIAYFFSHQNPFGFYRPLESAFLAIVQSAVGMNTFPIHATHVILHAVIAWMIVWFMRGSGYSTLQTGIAAGFFIVSQANVLVVASNDTFSQAAGTLFGCASVLCLFRSFDSGTRARRALFALSVLSFAVALLAKETSVSFFLILACVVLFSEWRRHAGAASRLATAAARMIPFVLVVIAYLIVRGSVTETKPSFGPGRNEFQIGWNILVNTGLSIAVMASPVSSVSAMQNLVTRTLGPLAMDAAAIVFFLSIVVLGLRQAWASDRVRAVGLFVLLALFPMVAMNHVSEAHTYNAMPFFATLVGVGLGALGQWLWRAQPTRIVFVGFMVSGVAVQYGATQSKLAMMRQNGLRASHLLEELRPYFTSLPANGELLLVNPPGQPFEYSVFVQPNFNVLRLGLGASMRRLSGRTDFTARIMDSMEEVEPNPARVTLTLSDGILQSY